MTHLYIPSVTWLINWLDDAQPTTDWLDIDLTEWQQADTKLEILPDLNDTQTNFMSLLTQTQPNEEQWASRLSA